jgi:hypothetical protein
MVRFVEKNMKMVKERDLLQKTCYGSRMIQKEKFFNDINNFLVDKDLICISEKNENIIPICHFGGSKIHRYSLALTKERNWKTFKSKSATLNVRIFKIWKSFKLTKFKINFLSTRCFING